MLGDFYALLFVIICGAVVGIYDLLWRRPGHLNQDDRPDDGKDEEC